MEVWGVTYQAMVPTTSYLLAAQMADSLRLLFKDQASIHQVACSVNDRGMFNLYGKFDFAPDPHLA